MILDIEKTGIKKQFYDLCLEVVDSCQLSLYDMDYFPGSHELKVFVWNTETKTAELSDCVSVDNAFSPFIETAEWMPKELTLEVSSPGLFRNLRNREHFETALGEKVFLHLSKPLISDKFEKGLPKAINGNKKIIVELKEVNSEGLLCAYENVTFNINFEQIKKASLETAF